MIEVAKDLKDRLDVNQLNELRKELFVFYSRIFNINDRGIPLPRKLLLHERFVIQDVIEVQTQLSGSSNENAKKQIAQQAD